MSRLHRPKRHLLKRLMKQFAARLGVVALVAQAIMPLSQGMAQAAALDRGQDASAVINACAPPGVELRQIDGTGGPDNQPPQTQATWDCPVCQLQISANLPTGPGNSSGWLASPREQRIEFSKERIHVLSAAAGRPNAPRAPPQP